MKPDVEFTSSSNTLALIGNEGSHCVYIRDQYWFRCGALKDVNGKALLQFGKDARPADIPLALWGGVGMAVLTPRFVYFGTILKFLLFTLVLVLIVFLLSVFQEWYMISLFAVQGPLFLVSAMGALFLCEVGNAQFDLEVQRLVKNSLQSRAIEYGWDLIYDCSCTKANTPFLEFKKRPILSLACPDEETSSSQHRLTWPSEICHYDIALPASGLVRCYPLLHGSVYAPRFRSAIDPWTWGAVISTLNDATLQHDDAELGHHAHREWIYYAWADLFFPVMLYFYFPVVMLTMFLHNFHPGFFVFVLFGLILINQGVQKCDRRLRESRLERSITVLQQALQKEFDGAVVMSLEDRIVWIKFRTVDENQTSITSMSIV